MLYTIPPRGLGAKSASFLIILLWVGRAYALLTKKGKITEDHESSLGSILGEWYGKNIIIKYICMRQT